MGGAAEILLAEDSVADVELTLRSLRRCNLGNHIRVTRDGEETLDALFAEGACAGQEPYRPDLILLDLKLPKIDGLEVLRRLKGDPRTRVIPIIMLTSSREQNDVIASYSLGVNSYIVKPVSFDQFAAAVVELGLYWFVHNRLPTPPRE